MRADEPTPLEAGGTNAIGRMLGLLGDEWSLLILQQALQGVSRYGQFKSALSVSDAVLTARLGTLTETGLLRRSVYQVRPRRAEYVVTPRSRSLWPVMLAIWHWERTWADRHPLALPTMRHDGCGQTFAPVVACLACDEPVEARDVAADWGPSGSWPRSVPHSATRRRAEVETAHAGAGLFPESMTIFGNRWGAAMTGASFRGVHRFTDFEACLGAPPTLVAERLRTFCAIGVLELVTTSTGPRRGVYRLTTKGRAFYPVVAAALQWAEQWFAAPEGASLLQRHRGCGAPFVAVFECDRCRRPLAGADVTVVPADVAERPQLPQGAA